MSKRGPFYVNLYDVTHISQHREQATCVLVQKGRSWIELTWDKNEECWHIMADGPITYRPEVTNRVRLNTAGWGPKNS